MYGEIPCLFFADKFIKLALKFEFYNYYKLTDMRKICFSSMLQEKAVQGFKRTQTSQRTLHEMV